MELWTFGHSTRSVDETLALLAEFDIARVVDVRSIPGSRRWPQFGAETMADWLPAAGVDYWRIADLGGRRRKQDVDPSVNAGWRHASFHTYADWTLGDGFETGIGELTDLATEPGIRAAIMCAEAVPWRCHRSLISTVLVFRHWRVTHILGHGQTQEHRPGQWGPAPVLRSDGKVVYPGEPQLGDG